MSLVSNDSLECPNCFQSHQVPVWKTINVSLDTDLKRKVLEQEVYRQCCPHCGTVYFLNHSLLYHDPSKQLMISCRAEESQQPAALPDRLPAVLRGYQTRSVGIPEALVEAIVVFDSDYDDRAVALLKYLLLRNLLATQASTFKKLNVLPLDPRRLLFVGSSCSHLCFLLLTSAPVPFTLLTEVDDYSKMLATVKSLSGENAVQEWASYDFAWAERLLSGDAQKLNCDLLFSPEILQSRPAAMPLWNAHCDRMARLQQSQQSKPKKSMWASFKRWMTEN